MTSNASVDIAVVGGGLVGTPLAIVLSQLGFSVALVDKQSMVDKPAMADNQSSSDALPKPGTRGFTAVSDSTVRALKKYQLWDAVAHDACAIEQVHVSHKGYFGSTNIKALDEQVAALGYVVDNAQLLHAFQTNIAKLAPSLQLIDNATVSSVKYDSENATLVYQKQEQEDKKPQAQQLSAKLLIAVDGVSSVLREASGIGVQQTDYDQVGILGTVAVSQPHDHIAYERFTPSGPLAMLPRPDNTASFVYCIDPKRRDEVEAMNDAQFMTFLQDAFGYRLGQFLSVSTRTLVPLLHIEAKQQTSDRLLLLGNAFRLVHPVAGQGYNLAMRDVEALCNTLADALHKAQTNNTHIDPGAPLLLQQFAQSRQTDHKTVVRLTDTLARSFRGAASLPAHVRALSLITLDRLPMLRHRFARRSMGKL